MWRGLARPACELVGCDMSRCIRTGVDESPAGCCDHVGGCLANFGQSLLISDRGQSDAPWCVITNSPLPVTNPLLGLCGDPSMSVLSITLTNCAISISLPARSHCLSSLSLSITHSLSLPLSHSLTHSLTSYHSFHSIFFHNHYFLSLRIIHSIIHSIFLFSPSPSFSLTPSLDLLTQSLISLSLLPFLSFSFWRQVILSHAKIQAGYDN